MATKFNKGDVVAVKTVVPSGPVEAFRVDEDGNMYYWVSWTDVNGEEQSRWFSEDELVLA